MKKVRFLQTDRAAIERLILKGQQQVREKEHPDPYIGELEVLLGLKAANSAYFPNCVFV